MAAHAAPNRRRRGGVNITTTGISSTICIITVYGAVDVIIIAVSTDLGTAYVREPWVAVLCVAFSACREDISIVLNPFTTCATRLNCELRAVNRLSIGDIWSVVSAGISIDGSSCFNNITRVDYVARVDDVSTGFSCDIWGSSHTGDRATNVDTSSGGHWWIIWLGPITSPG
jgi:hypothetical protein